MFHNIFVMVFLGLILLTCIDIRNEIKKHLTLDRSIDELAKAVNELKRGKEGS